MDIMHHALEILDETCEKNRDKDNEIMQGIDGEKEHAISVWHWLKKIKKNPSYELQVAALFHDIDRVVTSGVGGGFKGDRKSREYEEHKKAHAKRSAEYICPRLLERKFDVAFVERVRFLILHHDDTGKEVEKYNDKELDTLVAADSLAFFTSIAPKLYKVEGEERLKDKVSFMIEKMPPFAKEILSSQKLKNPIFEKVKNEVLLGFS